MKRIVVRCDKCGEIGLCNDTDDLVHEFNNCNGKLIKIDITEDEFDILCDIACDNAFLDAMIELKAKDPIEYQLKMSQFKTQLAQQESIQQQQFEQSQVKLRCPYCNSVNVRRISAIEQVSSISMLGMYSRKINKSFRCGSCGGTF